MTPPGTARSHRALAGCAALLVTATATAGCGYAPAAVTGKAATARSAADYGGMDALVRAAKKEGRLNVYALAPDWADYGEMIKTFEDTYGIHVNNENPGGSSQLALGAADKRRGQDRAVDALDLGTSFMRNARGKRLLAPYKVRGWRDIPAAQKQPDGSYLNNYGGYISIGCDARAVKKCPTTFAELLDPRYRNKVALNGNPSESSSAFSAIFAAALANGGSFGDVQPGLDYFKKLRQRGNFVPVESSPATIRKGETPISIDWDYLNLGYGEQLKAKGVDWRVAVPSDGPYAQYYNQGINAYAPHPAAARLWLEFLYSPRGQNIWLKGYARPALLDDMTRDGTVDKKAAARLPAVHGTPEFPTPEQEDAAKVAINEGWGEAVG
ncbi:extracellular solute-binding protein [Streptomyces sp. NPDC050161]|uniref:extracellular solute-binding protein n=1 Tax=Streptomyces sp. NPDC050161 TaxID=3365604 RepID=UPI0037A69D02